MDVNVSVHVEFRYLPLLLCPRCLHAVRKFGQQFIVPGTNPLSVGGIILRAIVAEPSSMFGTAKVESALLQLLVHAPLLKIQPKLLCC